MLIMSMLLAAASMPASRPQVTDNPFAQSGEKKVASRRRPSTKRSATRVPSNSGGSVYYANCTAARAAGAAPVMRGAPGYSRKLDRDNDGVGCE
jgi:hypothetical protein